MLYLIATASILLYGMMLAFEAYNVKTPLRRVLFPFRQSGISKRLFRVMSVVTTLWGALFTADAIIALRNGTPDTSTLFVYGLVYLLGVVVIHIYKHMPRAAAATGEHARVSLQ